MPDMDSKADTKEQQDRSQLRSDFLKVLSGLKGKECKMTLYSGFESSGKFQASDRDVLHFACENLTTPTGSQKFGQVRVTDIDSVTVNLRK
jgi:hypothetical protein